MDYLKINKAAWDKRTAIHIKSKMYDVAGFLAGDDHISLTDIELTGLGDVKGKSLLHLQCHFGQDTLSWARLGAKVTGVDLSSAAIEQATTMATQTGLDARFICSDVYSFNEAAQEQFDIVFTSFGTIGWLPDIQQWADVVARSLKPGGTFYIAEFHPFHDIFDGYSYFHKPEADVDEEGTYTENDTGETSTLMTWAHPLSDVVNALLAAGIQINQLNEYPHSPHNCFAGLVEREKGRFYLTHNGQDIPMVYSIKGSKVK